MSSADAHPTPAIMNLSCPFPVIWDMTRWRPTRSARSTVDFRNSFGKQSQKNCSLSLITDFCNYKILLLKLIECTCHMLNQLKQLCQRQKRLYQRRYDKSRICMKITADYKTHLSTYNYCLRSAGSTASPQFCQSVLLLLILPASIKLVQSLN